ncbi:unnamed protein product [Orchesella dallaii]|uniref:Uncharacterized protein n=1 Tax=Orchesella dallaii TaxID=48710 RepID=A0ABP1PUL2_9HEXA
MFKYRIMACKFRHFLALVVSVGITSLILCIFGRDQTAVNLEQIVSETHKQFESLKANLQNGDGAKRLEVEDKYISMLGFNNDDIGLPSKRGSSIASHLKNKLSVPELEFQNETLPVIIVSSVQKGQLLEAEEFIMNVQQFLPSKLILLWNVDPSTPIEEDNDFSYSLKQLCNSSTCLVKRFNFEDYPEHLKDLTLRAYRPIILQTLLDSGNCVLWLDIDRRLMRSSQLNLQQLLNLSQHGGSDGIIGWSAGHPTSSLTHPKMFPFFQTDVENYYFHRMIDPSQLLLCKTNNLVSKVMHPWVACTLKKDCVAPFGAQTYGCRFDKKPLYRYSGCHAYDAAALNVALGLAFPLHQPYIARSSISRPSQRYNLTTSS